ncbi:MAG: hypothetical protein Q7S87_01525 [Agitococcus sp.]|nr:hypothetical protein [Agitococcus sp.]
MTTPTVQGLGKRLSESAISAMTMLKSVFLRDIDAEGNASLPVVLESPHDVAHMLAVCAQVALLDNQKATLKAIKAQSANAIEASTQYAAFEMALPFQVMMRNKKGELELDKKEHIPTIEASGTKLAHTFMNAAAAFKLMATANIDELVTSTAFKSALDMRVSHPTKMSAPAGAGGYLVGPYTDVEPEFGHLTESEFKTRETVTLACTAGFQKMWVLLLPLVIFEGKTYRLSTLMAQRSDVADAVSTVFMQNDVPQGVMLVDAMRSSATISFSGEPQVFCGDLPNVAHVSVLAPFGLFNEVYRAKKEISAAYSLEQADRANAFDTDIAATEHALAELALLKGPAGKTAEVLTQKLKLTNALRELKVDKKLVSNTYLNIEVFPLLIGGGNPRNMAMDLDTSVHKANVQAFIPTIQQPVNQLGKRTLVRGAAIATALMGKVTVPSFKTLPRFLAAEALGADNKAKRAALFIELIAMAMSPLMALQEDWRTRADAVVDGLALERAAQDKIVISGADWSVFLKGDDTKNLKDLLITLTPLAKQVFDVVNTALQASFKSSNTPLSHTHDKELYDLALAAITQERA